MAKDKANIQVAEMKVQSYEEAFNKIKSATGITEVDKLVTTFIQNEEQNFSLFNFVNEQNNELEKLEEQIQQLHEEEEKYTQESGDDVNQHKQLLKDLETRLQNSEATAEKYELKYQEAMKTINALKVGIQSIFIKTECDTTAMADLLSDSQVTEANIMQFLGIIEQRTNEILQMWAAFTRRQADRAGDGALDVLTIGQNGYEADDPLSPGSPASGLGPLSGGLNSHNSHAQALVSILGHGPTTPMGQDVVQINPPDLGDYSSDEGSDDDDQDYRPLTHQELKIKTMKTIHKKAAHNRDSSHAGRSSQPSSPVNGRLSAGKRAATNMIDSHYVVPDHDD
mmetsp:Transcript_25259/g.80308  ORF Transcript_25259/g.80308 Transcript_25259/m.80308 type:complete len:339 (+) Transcript_25259:1-1017(+)